MIEPSAHETTKGPSLHQRAGVAGFLGHMLLLLALLLPIWVGPYPLLYDYQGHLLEAQVALRFDDPQLAYAEGFVARPQWMGQSNALMILCTVGFGRFVPLDLAGQLALSLLLALFLAGLSGLLRRAGTAKVFLPLAPLLAYNVTFGSGWLNFALASALGLCVLSCYEDYRRCSGLAQLLWITVLLSLIYSAHLVVWGLLALTLGVRAAADDLSSRRCLMLAASCAGALILAALWQPALVVIVLIGPAAWLGTRLFSALRWPVRRTVFLIGAVSLSLFTLGVVAQPWLQQIDADIRYSPFARLTFPVRTFTLAQQLPQPDRVLSAANLLLSGALAGLTCLLMVSLWKESDRQVGSQFAPLGVLALLYGAAPSFAGDIAVVEPRLIFWAALIVIGAVRLPAAGQRRRAIAVLTVSIGLLVTGSYTLHAVRYQHEAARWRSALLQLGPRAQVLVLQDRSEAARKPLPWIETYYNGIYFSLRSTIEGGGASSRVFGNGSFYMRPDLEYSAYLWRTSQDSPAPFDDPCVYSKGRFTAAVAWGALGPRLRSAFEACYGPGQPVGELTIWRTLR